MDKTFEVIICIVNNGYSEMAMETAKNFGARGGTVMQARGTASKESEKIFNVKIQPEKEMLMILVPQDLKENILHGLYNTVGINSDAQGIAFSMPVESVIGIDK